MRNFVFLFCLLFVVTKLEAVEKAKEKPPDPKEKVDKKDGYVSPSLIQQAKLEMNGWLAETYRWLEFDGKRDWELNKGWLNGMSYGMKDRRDKRWAYYRKCELYRSHYLECKARGLPLEMDKPPHPSNTKEVSCRVFHSRPETGSALFRGGEWIEPVTLEEIQEKNRQRELAKKKPKL